MTRLCVALFVRDAAQVRRDSAVAAEAGADLVELRIDQLTDAADVVAAVKASALPCIVTCRPVTEGGHSRLSPEHRLRLLLAAESANYLDIELAAGSSSQQWMESPRDQRPGSILSSHDFEGRPERLYHIVARLNESPAEVLKLVWRARSIRDNLEAFELLLTSPKPMIALCMGEAGLISRVLAKKFNAFLSFASLDGAGGTAAGQISIDDMKRVYRWDAINPETKVYGLIGAPVAHSMGPALHNAGFDLTGYNGVYLPLRVEAGFESFKAFMESAIAFEPLHLSGLSVTLPHKEHALHYLTERRAAIDPLALALGVVNTISIRREAKRVYLSGTNTDIDGLLDPITAALDIPREQLAGLRVGVIGAGGTGRTAVGALAHYGATVVVYNRTLEKARVLAAEFIGHRGKIVAAPLDKLCDSCCQVFINTTSVGMHPNVDDNAWGARAPELTAEQLVFDTVYNPLETAFLKTAKAAGARTIDGLQMFLRQAQGQFEAWTGQPAPIAEMRKVVETPLIPSPSGRGLE